MSHPIKSEPSLSASVSSTASSNQSGSNDFVKKLFLMLQEDSYKDVVRWTANGDSFVVLNTNEFTKEILPRHFKHSNFASFVRQLNKYDFHKVKVSNEEKMVYPYGEDAWEFKHPDFKINDRGSLENIKRKGPSSKKILSANTITNGGDFTSSSSVACNHNLSQITTAQSHLKDQVEQLRAENKQLHQDVNVLQTKYKTLIENIVAINTFDERYHRSMGILINCLLQAGIKLPPLDFPNPALMSLQQPSRHPQQQQPQSSSQIQSQQPQLPPSLAPSLIPPTQGPVVNPPLVTNVPPQLGHIAQLSPTIASPNGVRIPLQPGSAASQSVAPGVAVVPPPGPNEPGGPGGAAFMTGQGPPPVVARQASPSDTLTPKQQGNSSSGSPRTTGLVAQTTTTNIPNPKFHVLLVEDDNVCIQLCRKFLVKYGCQVTVVTDGLNAISTVEHTKYDLVLMDIVMPNLDGATATSVIRSFDTKTPIIAMTGNIEDNDLVTYLQNGMSDILAKPFTKDDLYSILSKHLLTDESKTAAAVGVTSRNISISGPTLPAESDEDPLLKKQRLQ